jgi:hypothetical protein
MAAVERRGTVVCEGIDQWGAECVSARNNGMRELGALRSPIRSRAHTDDARDDAWQQHGNRVRCTDRAFNKSTRKRSEQSWPVHVS